MIMKKVVLIMLSAIVLMACGGETKNSLVGTSWMLVELNGKPVDRAELMDKEAYTMNFEQDSTGVRVYGMGDCNRFFGMPVIDAENESILLGEMGVTRMMCPNQEREDEYIKALSEAKNYKLKDGSLVLLNGSDAVAKFTENKKQE